MPTLPQPADALYEVGDLVALAVSVREALEAGQKGQAAGQADRLGGKAAALRARLYQETAAKCGFEHIVALVGDELRRLRGETA